MGTLNAYPYIYFIIALPLAINGRNILILSAILGLAMDFVTGNMGVHMFTTIFAGMCRIILLPLLAPQGNYDYALSPSVNNNGWAWFLRYSTIIVILHHFMLFLVESFSFNNIGIVIFNTIACGILSLLTIIIIELAVTRE